MDVRHNIDICYSDLDRLLCDVIHPVLVSVRPRLRLSFCDRHFAGGRRLCVSLCGPPGRVASAARQITEAAGAFIRAHPSADVEDYSATVAASLLRLEEEPVDRQDLHYRNNVIVDNAPDRRQHTYASTDAAALADRFRHDALDLIVAILRSPHGKRHELLRLYFWYAHAGTQGRAPDAAMTFRAHWEGFAVHCPSGALLARIETAQRGNDACVRDLFRRTREIHEHGVLDGDPVLAAWNRILAVHAAGVRRLIEAGVAISRQPQTLEEARRLCEQRLGAMPRQTPLVQALWSDERFMASIQFEPAFLTARVLISLLYMIVAGVGLTQLDKMALCHYAYRAIEEACDCDAADLLARSVARIVARHAGRWTR